MKAPATILFTALLALPTLAQDVRREIAIPDLPDYRTLICDLHMHTVFSDGLVWPTVRVDEAWRTGLDVIAISDHIEYQPHAKDLPTNHNRPYELCVERAREYGLLLIRAAEITRSTPPGHFNAIFLDDVDPLEADDFLEVIKRANSQKAFVFWNHHDWKGEEHGAWGDTHQQMFKDRFLHGMEVANGESYYPRAHRWCLDRKLTMMGASDIHPPDLRRESSATDHRSLTLVFAREASVKGIREALFARRTAVWHKDLVIARSEMLAPLFKACVRLDAPHFRSGDRTWVRLHNDSEFEMRLKRVAGPGPRELTLPPRSTSLLKLRLEAPEAEIKLDYVVENFLVRPDAGLDVTLRPAPAGE